MISDLKQSNLASEMRESKSPKVIDQDPLVDIGKQTRNPSRDQLLLIHDNKKENKIKRQNTGIAETSAGVTLQESVMKMPIRYSLSSIREENKAERHFQRHLNAKNDQTRKETPPVDISMESDLES